MKPRTVTVEGYATVDARVGPGGNSGRVYVPSEWLGIPVLVVALEEPKPKPKKE